MIDQAHNKIGSIWVAQILHIERLATSTDKTTSSDISRKEETGRPTFYLTKIILSFISSVLPRSGIEGAPICLWSTIRLRKLTVNKAGSRSALTSVYLARQYKRR